MEIQEKDIKRWFPEKEIQLALKYIQRQIFSLIYNEGSVK